MPLSYATSPCGGSVSTVHTGRNRNGAEKRWLQFHGEVLQAPSCPAPPLRARDSVGRITPDPYIGWCQNQRRRPPRVLPIVHPTRFCPSHPIERRSQIQLADLEDHSEEEIPISSGSPDGLHCVIAERSCSTDSRIRKPFHRQLTFACKSPISRIISSTWSSAFCCCPTFI